MRAVRLNRPKPWWYYSPKGKVMALCPICSVKVGTAARGPLLVQLKAHSRPGVRGYCPGGGTAVDLNIGTLVADKRDTPTA